MAKKKPSVYKHLKMEFSRKLLRTQKQLKQMSQVPVSKLLVFYCYIFILNLKI